MRATLYVHIPFIVFVPEGHEFPLHEYVDEGCRVVVLPPVRSDYPVVEQPPDGATVDGAIAFVANALSIDFYRESFDRTIGCPLDPPEALVRKAVNSFLVRLRYVARAFFVPAIDFPRATWSMLYTNDDGSPLETPEGLFQGRGGKAYRFRYVGIGDHLWQEIGKLPPDFEPPPWEVLLLDAQAQLPHVGSAIVLAFTALEVLIAKTLDQLVPAKPIAGDLWSWINKRDDLRARPSVQEQYTHLLKHLCGHSLSEEAQHWATFIKLRKARNAFAHRGVAKIDGRVVDEQEALNLIAATYAVVRQVREWLPAPLQWPLIDLTTTVQTTTALLKA